MNYFGDIRLGDTMHFKFTTRQFSTGAPFTLAGTPAVAAYPNASTTEITAGITLTVDFDSRTGLNHLTIVATSGNGYATSSHYILVITAGTVDSVSVVGEVVGSFSIEARSALMPTTGARTLDVSATGEADANVAQWLGAAPNALVSSRVDASVGAVAAGAITASAIAADAIGASELAADAATEIAAAVWDEARSTHVDSASFGAVLGVTGSGTAQAGAAGSLTLAAGSSAIDDFYNSLVIKLISGTGSGQARLISDYVGSTKVATITPNWATTPDSTAVYIIQPMGPADLQTWRREVPNVLTTSRVDASVGAIAAGAIASGSFAAGAIDAAAIAANAIGASELAADAVTEIAQGVWDHTVPGLHTSGEAGFVIGAINTKTDTIIQGIQKNTAFSNFHVFMVDSTSHTNGIAGISVTGQRAIDGGAIANIDNAVAEIGLGLYRVNLTAADLNGDIITLGFNGPGADTRLVTIITKP